MLVQGAVLCERRVVRCAGGQADGLPRPERTAGKIRWILLPRIMDNSISITALMVSIPFMKNAACSFLLSMPSTLPANVRMGFASTWISLTLIGAAGGSSWSGKQKLIC